MLKITFKKRYRDFNKGDTDDLVEIAALYKVSEQRMLTRLLTLDAIEFPGKSRLIKPTPKGVAKKPSGSVSKPKTKTVKKTAKSSGLMEENNGL